MQTKSLPAKVEYYSTPRRIVKRGDDIPSARLIDDNGVPVYPGIVGTGQVASEYEANLVALRCLERQVDRFLDGKDKAEANAVIAKERARKVGAFNGFQLPTLGQMTAAQR